MKKLVLFALLPALLLGCQDRGADATETDPVQVEAAVQEPAEETTEEVTEETAEAEVAEAQTTETAEVPEGYTRVPDLSEEPVREFEAEPEFALEEGQDYYAVMDTNRGQILIDLYEDVPTSSNSFVWLARHNYYDDLLFHRVIEGFVVQGGDPKTADRENRAEWGTGGPGYTIPLEVRQKYTFDEKGVLGMARAQDPNSGGSQFYITLAPTPMLNGQYTVFGKVVKGLDVLDEIKKYEAPAEGEPDVMQDVYIVTKNQE